MYTSNPKITVLMTIYNGVEYLPEAIEGVLRQTFSNFEFIIIDDCSTDNGVWSTLNQYAEQDRRIKLFRNENNLGQAKSLNKGLELARGEYVARQDGDDISMPDRLEKQINLLDKNPEFIFVSSEIEFVNSRGTCLGVTKLSCSPDLVRWYMLFSNYVLGHSQITFRREPTIKSGGYCESSDSCITDYELWCRLLEIGKCAIVPKPLIKYRKHDKNFSISNKSKVYSRTLNLAKRNLESVLGQVIDLEEVDALYRFWVISAKEGLPKSIGLSHLNSRLQDIYQAFLQKEHYFSGPRSDMSRDLKAAIGNQYARWVASPLSQQHSLGDKIKLSYYGASWNLKNVLIGWAKWIVKSITRLAEKWIKGSAATS